MIGGVTLAKFPKLCAIDRQVWVCWIYGEILHSCMQGGGIEILHHNFISLCYAGTSRNLLGHLRVFFGQAGDIFCLQRVILCKILGSFWIILGSSWVRGGIGSGTILKSSMVIMGVLTTLMMVDDELFRMLTEWVNEWQRLFKRSYRTILIFSRKNWELKIAPTMSDSGHSLSN